MEQFDRQAVKRWRKRVWTELRRLDLADGRESYIGLTMVAVASLGTGIDVLTELTGQSAAFIRSVLRSMRKAHILKGQTLSIRWDKEGFEGQVSLACDVLATAGDITRVGNPKRVKAAKQRVGQRPPAPHGTPPPRRPRSVAAPNAIFTPKVRMADAWYQANSK